MRKLTDEEMSLYIKNTHFYRSVRAIEAGGDPIAILAQLCELIDDMMQKIKEKTLNQ